MVCWIRARYSKTIKQTLLSDTFFLCEPSVCFLSLSLQSGVMQFPVETFISFVSLCFRSVCKRSFFRDLYLSFFKDTVCERGRISNRLKIKALKFPLENVCYFFPSKGVSCYIFWEERFLLKTPGLSHYSGAQRSLLLKTKVNVNLLTSHKSFYCVFFNVISKVVLNL